MKIIDYNPEQEKKILCLPGLFMNGECFEEIAMRMPDYHFLCVSYDSFHYSSGDFESLEQQSGKIIAMLKERGTTTFELVMGTSLGTVFACHLAAGHRLQIKRLWLDGGVVLGEYRVKKFYEWIIYTLFHKIMVQAHEEGNRGTFMGKEMPEDWLRRTEEPRKALTERSMRNITHLLAYYHIEEGIEAPIYMTYGEKEANVRMNATQIRALYPETKISVEPGYDHLEYMDAETDEYVRRVRQVMETGAFAENKGHMR